MYLSLFSNVGPLEYYTLHCDQNGRSKGTAEVVFEKGMDGVEAFRRYNNTNLDGRKLKIDFGMENDTSPHCPPAPNDSGLNQSYASSTPNDEGDKYHGTYAMPTTLANDPADWNQTTLSERHEGFNNRDISPVDADLKSFCKRQSKSGITRCTSILGFKGPNFIVGGADSRSTDPVTKDIVNPNKNKWHCLCPGVYATGAGNGKTIKLVHKRCKEAFEKDMPGSMADVVKRVTQIATGTLKIATEQLQYPPRFLIIGNMKMKLYVIKTKVKKEKRGPIDVYEYSYYCKKPRHRALSGSGSKEMRKYLKEIGYVTGSVINIPDAKSWIKGAIHRAKCTTSGTGGPVRVVTLRDGAVAAFSEARAADDLPATPYGDWLENVFQPIP